MSISPENIEIRQAVPADATLISVLAAATFYEAYFEQDAPDSLAGYISESFDHDSVLKQVCDPAVTFFLVFLNDRAVGYAKLIAGSREPCITSENVIELKRIYLIERVWRKGIGEALLRHCIDEARRVGMDSIWLGVWEMNSRARPFYEKHGFVKVGTLEFIYNDLVGINDVMELKL